MPSTIVKAANTSLIALLDRVHKGGEVTIERDGQAVALLIATNPEKCFDEPQFETGMIETAQDHTFKTVDNKGFQELCDAYASAV